VLLFAKADYAAQGGTASGGVNCSDRLSAALKLLQDDPYLAVGIATGSEATEVPACLARGACRHCQRAVGECQCGAIACKARGTAVCLPSDSTCCILSACRGSLTCVRARACAVRRM